jgi:hypothetical protein
MKLFIYISTSGFIYRLPEDELSPNCSLDQFGRDEALFVLEAGCNNLDSAWCSVNFLRVIWQLVSNL